jgi:hypothetical protein
MMLPMMVLFETGSDDEVPRTASRQIAGAVGELWPLLRAKRGGFPP